MANEKEFRIFNKNVNQYANFNNAGDAEITIDPSNGTLYGYGVCGGDQESFFALDENYILEQWIGLKDKNGVKIYEGDIVKYKYYTGVRLITRIDVVKYCNTYGCYCFGVNPLYGHYELGSAEVIGNINQNKELLERVN